jgi:hypothetical protein
MEEILSNNKTDAVSTSVPNNEHDIETQRLQNVGQEKKRYTQRKNEENQVKNNKIKIRFN